jgi:hypothetical protein
MIAADAAQALGAALPLRLPRHPSPLVRVPAGEASVLDVLDIDAPRHPEAAEWWARRQHRAPATRIHQTRSGGLHVLFRHAGGLRSWAGRPVPGVDGRADGGHVVWWPVDGLPIRSPGPPAPFPRWLIQALACAIKKRHARSAAQFERAERSGDPGALERFVALITRHSQPRESSGRRPALARVVFPMPRARLCKPQWPAVSMRSKQSALCARALPAGRAMTHGVFAQVAD